MPQCCAVPHCSEKKGGHKFPKDKTVSEQWLVAIRRENCNPSQNWRVCKKHFNPDDYELPKESYSENLPKCSNSASHAFPRENVHLQKWLRAMRMESYAPTKWSRLCRKHFKDDDYELPKDSVVENPHLRLKKDAVPSIFPWTSSHSSSQDGMIENLSNQDTIKSHDFTNYNFKSEPPDIIQNINNDKKTTLVSLEMHKSRKLIPAKIEPSVKKKIKVKRMALTMKTPQRDCPIRNINPAKLCHLVFCDTTSTYLSSESKSPCNKFPGTSEMDPLLIKSTSNLHPNETITSTMSALETQNFINSEDNTIKIKYESPDEKMECEDTLSNNVQVEINQVCNKSVNKSVRIQCNLCQCSKHYQNQNVKCITEKKFCIENLLDVTNPAEVQFFTGFKDYEQLKYVFNLLGADVYNLKYFLHKSNSQVHFLLPFDEFLLTIIKLRRNKSFTELGFKFRTSTVIARIIFTTWINFLFRKFKELACWMPEDVINKYMSFVRKRCMVIIHCTGIQLKHKENKCGKVNYTILNPDKSFKVFVEMTESGNSKFISEVLSGSLSDMELIKKYTESTQMRQPNITRKIIGLSKLYSILNGNMHSKLVHLANQVVFVCFMLTHFLKRL